MFTSGSLHRDTGRRSAAVKANTRLLHLNRVHQDDLERRSLLINQQAHNAQKTAEGNRASAQEQMRCLRQTHRCRSIDLGDVRRSLNTDNTFTFSQRNMYNHLTPAVMEARTALRNRKDAQTARQPSGGQTQHSKMVAREYYRNSRASVSVDSTTETPVNSPVLSRSQSEPDQGGISPEVRFAEHVTVSNLHRTSLVERVEVETLKNRYCANTKSVLFTEFCRKRAGFEKPVVQSCCGRRQSCPSTLRCRPQVNRLIDHLNHVPCVTSSVPLTSLPALPKDAVRTNKAAHQQK